jgi:lipopolysaccharide/colanic/teichoic acid biosynthesis glycosyltransferase
MKRAFDLVLAIVGLVLLLPILALIAIAIAICDGPPVLFHQERIGWRGKPFFIHKFRTMCSDPTLAARQLTVDGDPRVTWLGHLLRKSKLDELPQLFNVLMGEMSFVGPRPEVPQYVARYTAHERRVLEVVPGITDAASLRFFNESELLSGLANPEQTYLDEIVPEKIRMNLDYAAQASLLTDLGILLQTFARMCRA